MNITLVLSSELANSNDKNHFISDKLSTVRATQNMRPRRIAKQSRTAKQSRIARQRDDIDERMYDEREYERFCYEYEEGDVQRGPAAEEDAGYAHPCGEEGAIIDGQLPDWELDDAW